MKANLAQNIPSRDTEQEQVAGNKSDFVYETSDCLYCKILSSPDLEKTRERSIIDKAEEAVSTIYLSWEQNPLWINFFDCNCDSWGVSWT